MRTVYLVGHGQYDAYAITGVYGSIERAVAAARLDDDPDITEWSVDGDEQRSAWYGVSTVDAYKRPRPGPKWHGDLADAIAALD